MYGNNFPELPLILADIVQNLRSKYPNCSTSTILNITLTKVAQMITAKRMKYAEFKNQGFPNYYGIVFMPSGFGKDRITNDLDNYIFQHFRQWFKEKAGEFKKKRFEDIENAANERFVGDKYRSKRAAFIRDEQAKVRNMVIEMKNGTQEGFFADAQIFAKAGFGSLFVKISEFGLYLNNAKNEEKQFINRLFDAYDAKADGKCIKGDTRDEDVEDTPCNALLYSDYTLFQKELKRTLDTLLHTGMGRRAVISFLANSELYIEPDPEKAYENEENFYKSAETLCNRLHKLFVSIKPNSIYVLDKETHNNVFYPYKIKITQQANTTDNSALRLELISRELKVLKVACLYACLNHPNVHQILPEDMNQAISTIEFMSVDYRAFINHRPAYSDKYDRLFNFFLANIDNEFSKTELTHTSFKEFGFSRKKFILEFDESMEIVAEMAASKGYILQKTMFNNNSGIKYRLLELRSQELSSDVIPLEKIINMSEKAANPVNAI